MRNEEDPAGQAMENWDTQKHKILLAFPKLDLEELESDTLGKKKMFENLGLRLGRTKQELLEILNQA